ncbi:DUF3992 domain-containing protein [Bacillus sp. NTK071]|uniref:S-Ena type endospore appendage n=1 Tax=Bacillus sp. NTK071 TaxID=2802175 RepID=UPI001A903289|nr:DUF3992 domain-containing protein [Bacillus sp. NTK071]
MGNYYYKKKKSKVKCDKCYLFDCTICEKVQHKCYDNGKRCVKCCNEEKKQIITEEVCGNISTDCTQGQTTLWQTPLCSAFGTVSVFSSGECETMDVFINDELSFSVKKGQTQSITVPKLKKVAVMCQKNNYSCTGKFCINLHYEKPVKNCCKYDY